MSNVIPTIDLSPFFTTTGDDEGKKKARDLINEACSTFGFFQIVNHGVPLELMKRATQVSKTFFDSPQEEKLKAKPTGGAPLPAGYMKRPENSADNAEMYLMFPPGSTFNVLPENLTDFKKSVAEDLFTNLLKTSQLLETILAECLGLPPSTLQKFNDHRSVDFMMAINYYKESTTGPEANGLAEHEDGNVFTLVLQDQVGGLQVLKDEEWIPVIPSEGTLVVNIGDVLQVLSNNKYKSATHRVILDSKVQNRYSFAFFYNLFGEKWVEPLPEFTTLIGKPAEYKGFYFKDYQTLRMRPKFNPPYRPDDVIKISHYSIPA